jgi:predicted DNA-binding transcriptional regulator AlpA
MECKLIPSATVREICGGISDMSLWRWLNDPAMGFPRPLVISRRRYWREADIARWIAERERAAA